MGSRAGRTSQLWGVRMAGGVDPRTGPSDNQAYQASPRAYQASHWAHPPIADQATSPARQALRPAAAQMTYVQMAALVNCRTRLTGQPGNAQTAGPAGMRMPGALYSAPMNGTAADPPDERSAARRSAARRSADPPDERSAARRSAARRSADPPDERSAARRSAARRSADPPDERS